MLTYITKETWLPVPEAISPREEIFVSIDLSIDTDEESVWIETVHRDGTSVSPMDAIFEIAEKWVFDRTGYLLREAEMAEIERAADLGIHVRRKPYRFSEYL